MKKSIALLLSLVFAITLFIGCEDKNSSTYTGPSSTNTSTDSIASHTHSIIDDGNCLTPAYCSDCGEMAIDAQEHKYNDSVSFEFNDDNFLLGGSRLAHCSNEGCTYATTKIVSPFIYSYGYSVCEYNTNDWPSATITASYDFNLDDIRYYLIYLNNNNDKKISIEYGTLGYVKDLVKYAPLKANGSPAPYVIKENFSNKNDINDFSISRIGVDYYDEEIVICAYFIIDKDIYYIQGNRIITDYQELETITVSSLIENA